MHWLDRYGTDYHKWHLLPNAPLETWYRPTGLVESMFGVDGTNFEGRADINTLLEAEISTHDCPEALRKKILLAWAVLRFQYVLLSARALCRESFVAEGPNSSKERFFVIRKPESLDGMMNEASRTLSFVDDYYPEVDVKSFYTHVMNTGRVFDISENLARIFILPIRALPNSFFSFTVISAVAHEIADALSIYRWHASFLHLLNSPTSVLEAQALHLCSISADIHSRLPQAQEDLYPPIPGNSARQRWFWAISRILRHVRHPPPPSFPNPLQRETRLKGAEAMPPHYAALLDYSKTPPLNTYFANANLSPTATARMKTICRSSNVSIGSGVFALVALVMMILYEKKFQSQRPLPHQASLPAALRHHHRPLPFVASFPLNPRPFLRRPSTGEETSLILSFSDGLTLPYLPSSLPLSLRFRFLARLAHRQLRVYQKRKPASASPRISSQRNQSSSEPSSAPPLSSVDSRSASQTFPQLYLYSLERNLGVSFQGSYPPRTTTTSSSTGLSATCGISSIGDRSALIAPLPSTHLHHSASTTLSAGQWQANAQAESQAEEGAASESVAFSSFNFQSMTVTVRARPGEFLVASAGHETGIMGFTVSFDGCDIDPGRVEAEWKTCLESILEDTGDAADPDGQERTDEDRGGEIIDRIESGGSSGSTASSRIPNDGVVIGHQSQH